MNTEKVKKDEVFQIRIDTETKNLLKEQAKKSGKTMGAYLRYLIQLEKAN